MSMGEASTRKARISYCSPFVPAEWIAAHGLQPRFVRPYGLEVDGPIDNTAGVCSYLRAFVNEAAGDKEADAIVLTTACDQMRRAYEILADRSEKPAFLMHMPTTWQSPGAHRYYRDEVQRLGRFLVNLGGRAPSHQTLISTMERYEAQLAAAGEPAP